VGDNVGTEVGIFVGGLVGLFVGIFVGDLVGLFVGAVVGEEVVARTDNDLRFVTTTISIKY